MSNNRIQAGVKCLDLIGLLLLIPITINFAEGQSTQIGLHFHSPTPAWIVKCTMSGIGVLITSRFIDPMIAKTTGFERC